MTVNANVRLAKVLNAIFTALIVAMTVMMAFYLVTGILKCVVESLSSSGYTAYATTGHSMEPYVYEGDLVVVENDRLPQDGENMIFWTGEAADAHLVFHRVLHESLAEGTGYVTKGDNNESIDEGLVSRRNVVGTEVLHLSGMGWLTSRYPTGLVQVLTSVIGFSLVALLWMIRLGRLQLVPRRSRRCDAVLTGSV